MNDVNSRRAQPFPASTSPVSNPPTSLFPTQQPGSVPSLANTVNVDQQEAPPAPTAPSFLPQSDTQSPADLPQQPSQNTLAPSDQNVTTGNMQPPEQPVQADCSQLVLIKTNVDSSTESDSQSQTSVSADDVADQRETRAEGPNYSGGCEAGSVLGKRNEPPSSEGGSVEDGDDVSGGHYGGRKRVKVCTLLKKNNTYMYKIDV